MRKEYSVGQAPARLWTERDIKARTTISIFFSYHVTARDMEPLWAFLPGTDVYVPEAMRQEHLESIYNRVAAGDITPAEALLELHTSNPPLTAELNHLAGTGVAVSIADVPRTYRMHTDDRIFTEPYMVQPSLYRASEKVLVFPFDFEQSIALMRRYFEQFADWNREREAYIVAHVVPAICAALERQPRLGTKPNLRVLMQLGSSHTGIARTLRREGYRVESHLSRDVLVVNHKTEARKRTQYGLAVTDELLARSLLERILYDVFGNRLSHATDDTQAVDRAVRVIADAYSYDEIRDLYTAIRSMGPQDNLRGTFIFALAEKGIRIPFDEEDAEILIRFGTNRIPLGDAFD